MIKTILKIIGVLLALMLVAIAGLLSTLNASVPADRYPLPPPSAEAIDRGDDGYLIFGATRNTGLEVARILRERGEKVTAFVRSTSDRSGLEAIGAQFAVGDAMEPETVHSAFDGKKYRAVVTTIGCLRCEPPIDFEANKNVIDGAKSAGVDRVVLITTIGAGDSADASPWMSSQVLARTLPLKSQAEEYLRSSGLDYTIVRPGGLRSDAETGNGIITENRDAFGFIFRRDLAYLLVGILDDPGTIGKTFAAIDSKRAWPWSNE